MDPRRIWQTKSGRAAALIAAGVLSAIVFVRAMDPAPLTYLRERTFDTYQRIQPRPYGDFPVRVVDIDEASLASQGQWPWPRTLLARLVQRLNELGAAVVAFDIWFPEADRTSPQQLARELRYSDAAEAKRITELMSLLPDHDRIFADAIKQAPVVLGFAASTAKPTVISDEEITVLRTATEKLKAEPHPYLNNGDPVRIVAGPLTGMTGILTRRKQEYRVVLSIEAIMRSIVVEVSEFEIEPRVKKMSSLDPIHRVPLNGVNR